MPRTSLPQADALGPVSHGPTSAPLRRRSLMAGLVGAVGLTAACGSSDRSTGDGDSDGGGSAEGFPLEPPNCEATLTFDAPPERIVLLESAPVTTLDGVGVLTGWSREPGPSRPATTTRTSPPASRRSRRSATRSTPPAICRSPRRW